MKKLVIIVALLVLISPISLAQEPGRLWINDVLISHEKSLFDDAFSDLEDLFAEKAKSTFYIYANNQRIAKKDETGTYYFHNDHLGSPRVITDNEGNTVWEADYLPFGEVFNEQGSNDVKYNSKELDLDTKLHYYGVRYYLDGVGRFINADEIKFTNIKDPQSFNLYVYTANNPLRYIDLSGNQKNLPTVAGGGVVKPTAAITKPHREWWQKVGSKIATFLEKNTGYRRGQEKHPFFKILDKISNSISPSDIGGGGAGAAGGVISGGKKLKLLKYLKQAFGRNPTSSELFAAELISEGKTTAKVIGKLNQQAKRFLELKEITKAKEFQSLAVQLASAEKTGFKFYAGKNSETVMNALEGATKQASKLNKVNKQLKSFWDALLSLEKKGGPVLK